MDWDPDLLQRAEWAELQHPDFCFRTAGAPQPDSSCSYPMFLETMAHIHKLWVRHNPPTSICFRWQSVLAMRRVTNTGVGSPTVEKKAVVCHAASCTPKSQHLTVRRNSSWHLDLLWLLHIGSAVSSLGISPLPFVKVLRRTFGSHCSLCAAH